MEFGSCDFGGGQVSCDAIYKLENQEGLWYNSVRDKDLRTRTATGLSLRV